MVLRYLEWEDGWNLLGSIRKKQRVYRLRNKGMMVRSQWWIGRRGNIRWLEEWVEVPANAQYKYNRHLRSKSGQKFPLGGGGWPARPSQI